MTVTLLIRGKQMKPAIECLHSKAFTLKMKCSYPHVRIVKHRKYILKHTKLKKKIQQMLGLVV